MSGEYKMDGDDGMGDVRDERLRHALAHAPDHTAAPNWRLRKAILDHAHEAVAPSLAPAPVASARSWWQRLLGLGGPGGARMPWNAAFATVLVAVLVTVLWQREPVPGARPDSEAPAATPAARPAESPAAPAAAPPPAPVPEPTPAPAPAPAPAPSPPTSERALPSSQDIPGTPLPPPEPAPPAKAARTPERPAAAPAEPARRQAEEAALAAAAGDSAKEARKREAPAQPPAMATAPAPVTPPSGAAGAARDAGEPSRPAAAAAAAPAPRAAESSEPPSFAALSQWSRMTITPRGGTGRSLSRSEAPELNALLGSAAISAVGPQPLAGAAEWRVTLERGNGEVLATFELGRDQVRWREGRKPATTGAPSAGSLAALRDALQRAVAEPPAQAPALQWQPAQPQQPPAEAGTAPAAPSR